MEKNAIIDLKNISVTFGNNQVLKNLNLYIRDKEFITFLGPSGCGKSTIGRLLAEKLGKIFVDADEEIVRLAGMPIPDIFAILSTLPDVVPTRRARLVANSLSSTLNPV